MWKDIRYALRILRGAPAFAITVVLTLGVGLGLNTALFTLFDAYVLHPFAVKDPHTLYRFSWTTKASTRSGLSWEQYEDLHSAPIFRDTLAFSPFLARVDSRNLQGMGVSGNYFTMLGVGASLGRPILPEDASAPGSNAVVVLSHQIWKAAYSGDPSLVGRSIRIGGRLLEVIGIGPSDFFGVAESPVDFFIPLTMQSAVTPGPDFFGPEKPSGVLAVGRLRQEIPSAKAQAALTVWIRHATEQLPAGERAVEAQLVKSATPVSMDPEMLAAFLPLVVVFGLVLVICCANVSNMMLARALARQREIGVRLAMGAPRFRLIRQLLSENLLLSLLAGGVGFGVSLGAIRGGQRLLTATIPSSLNLLHIAPLDPDYRVFLFVLGTAVLTTVLFGLAPALQATRTFLVEALRGEFGARVSSSRLRSMLVISQISVCLTLLVLTGILLRGSAQYQQQVRGLDFHGVVYPFFLGRSDIAASAKVGQRLATEPWVDVWAAVWHPPLRSVEEIPVRATNASPWIRTGFNMVSGEYFRVLGIPILRGRDFIKAETESEAAVAIISEATARKFWPNEDVLGKTIGLDRTASGLTSAPRVDQAVIIGIAKDVASGRQIDAQDPTMIYLPTSPGAKRTLTFLIRGKGSVASATRQLETMLEATVPDRPVLAISLDEMFATQMYPFRAAAWIAAMLGGLALLLTLSGMYGVLSYLVGQRTKEIGIRIALGATPGIVARLVLRQSLGFAIWGVGVGLTAAFCGALLLRHLLTLINALDLIPYASGATIVVVASLAAALFPSSRAARINPVETLRAD